MKLIFCTECHDVFKLVIMVSRNCECGKCGGYYGEDGLNAEYWGDTAVPLGFLNSSLLEAVRDQPKKGSGEVFEAFVIPRQCDTMKKRE